MAIKLEHSIHTIHGEGRHSDTLFDYFLSAYGRFK